MNWSDNVTLRIFAERTNPHATTQRHAQMLASQYDRSESLARQWRERHKPDWVALVAQALALPVGLTRPGLSEKDVAKW